MHKLIMQGRRLIGWMMVAGFCIWQPLTADTNSLGWDALIRSVHGGDPVQEYNSLQTKRQDEKIDASKREDAIQEQHRLDNKRSDAIWDQHRLDIKRDDARWDQKRWDQQHGR